MIGLGVEQPRPQDARGFERSFRQDVASLAGLLARTHVHAGDHGVPDRPRRAAAAEERHARDVAAADGVAAEVRDAHLPVGQAHDGLAGRLHGPFGRERCRARGDEASNDDERHEAGCWTEPGHLVFSIGRGVWDSCP